MSVEYKESPLGMIPSDWEIVKSSSVFELIHGYQFRDFDFTETGLPIVKIGQINRNGEIDMNGCSFFSSDRAEEFADKRIFNGDVLMALTGATLGKSCWVSGLENPVYQNYRVGKFVPHDEKVLSKQFLYFLVGSPLALDQIMAKINSGAQGNVGKSDFEKLKIPLPPLPEQQKIAEILSTVDAKIEVIDQQITETQALKKGLMQQLLTGKLSVIEKRTLSSAEMKDSPLGEIPKSWEVLILGAVTEQIKDGTHATHKEVLGGIPLLSAKDIRNGRIYIPNDCRKLSQEDFNSIHKNFKIKNGDVLLTVVGSIGRVAVIENYDDNYTFQRSVGYIRLNNENNPYFFKQYFQSDIFLKQLLLRSNASAQAGVYLGELGKIPIVSIPLVEQIKIAEILDSVDTKLEVLSEKKTHYQELKQGLMQHLLTGKIRVNNLIAQI